MYYFNFYELQLNCEDQIPAIFVLTVGLTLEYYKFHSKIDFRYKCFNLLDIPNVLIKRRLIRKNYHKEYEVLYRTLFPQSYFRNNSFLKANLPIIQKVQYLKLLSYRAINDQNDWIPTDYIQDLSKIHNNELLEITDKKIHFKYEG
jgi:hypothetical protein